MQSKCTEKLVISFQLIPNKNSRMKKQKQWKGGNNQRNNGSRGKHCQILNVYGF